MEQEDSIMKDSKLSSPGGCLTSVITWVSRYALTAILTLIVLGILFSLARAAIYKIRPWERGLHVRGGKFIGVDEPGWHIQIPFADTVIPVVVSEQYGEIQELAAITSDEVTMDVSLLYTYRVDDPVQYQLEVLDPKAIIDRFVQATLRDVINTRSMSEVMNNRPMINSTVLGELRAKEAQYGIAFVTVQLQSASPPAEVVSAIKDRMVATQRQAQSEAEAAQQRTLADSEFYAAQKKADADAYELRTIAEAEAESLKILSSAELEAMKSLLDELLDRNPLAEQYIQLLIARELGENSKWIITGDGQISPLIDVGETP
jgi:regulator of protease activity HflC (stomatin/prohibitin superfamily)